MLAKEIKIMTILKQREFIRQRLEEASYNQNGNPAYTYIGHIYLENIVYFKDEGYNISQVKSDTLTADVEGIPVWLLTPIDDIVLNDEEMSNAEVFAKANSHEEEAYDDDTSNLVFSIRGSLS